MRGLDEDVVPERDKVAFVDERKCSLRVLSAWMKSRCESGDRAEPGSETDLGTGKMCLRTSCTRLPSLDPKPSKIRLYTHEKSWH